MKTQTETQTETEAIFYHLIEASRELCNGLNVLPKQLGLNSNFLLECQEHRRYGKLNYMVKSRFTSLYDKMAATRLF